MRRDDWKRYGAGILIACLWGWGAAMVGNADYADALTQDAIRKDPPAMVSPLSCPLEDEHGHALRATMADFPHDQCDYGPSRETGARSNSGRDHKRSSRGLKANRHLEKP